MSSYGFLAGCYDQFTTDVDYAAWGDYIQRHFQKNARSEERRVGKEC